MDANQTDSGAPQSDPQVAGQDTQQDAQGVNAGAAADGSTAAPVSPVDPAAGAAQGTLIDAGAGAQGGSSGKPPQDAKDDKPGLLTELEEDAKKLIKFIKVRVLRVCEHGQPDDVVALAPRAAKAAEKAGHVDTNPEAVAYAESLKTPDAS